MGYWTGSEGLSIDFKEGRGDLFNYFVYGASCCEVEINCLTGSHRVFEYIHAVLFHFLFILNRF